MLDRARAYFASQDVLAVDTPTLSRFAGSDPNIDSIAVHSQHSGDFFLHTCARAIDLFLMGESHLPTVRGYARPAQAIRS